MVLALRAMVRATEGMGMAKVEAGTGVGAGVTAAVEGWVAVAAPRP